MQLRIPACTCQACFPVWRLGSGDAGLANQGGQAARQRPPLRPLAPPTSPRFLLFASIAVVPCLAKPHYSRLSFLMCPDKSVAGLASPWHKSTRWPSPQAASAAHCQAQLPGFGKPCLQKASPSEERSYSLTWLTVTASEAAWPPRVGQAGIATAPSFLVLDKIIFLYRRNRAARRWYREPATLSDPLSFSKWDDITGSVPARPLCLAMWEAAVEEREGRQSADCPLASDYSSSTAFDDAAGTYPTWIRKQQRC
ncbi:hypothetical protein Micbo1qcDRAFT_179616 [Microdochium bolleyi]|uniref:Uncharacterized protein n=1 Tax=Microdochium bolleyi TaxID=196109 RepID=A0A136INX8_9PEZI|nr:hypothetical protein Micbo1qcDRAFT_179616 [Microdochium bolleyi]